MIDEEFFMADMCKLMNLMLERRGYTSEYLKNIENPYHGQLKSVPETVDYLKFIHDNRLLIVIFPDFDMDGICAGTCDFAGYSELGFNVALYMPDTTKGYGFDASDIDRLIALYPDVSVIMTCDVGITCYDGITRAKERGVEVLLTDHHKEKAYPAGCRRAAYTINPMRVDEEYAHPAICGAYVSYQLLMAYAEKYGSADAREQIRRLLVFAGLGTISDSMPLLYENREIVREAINMCRIVYSDGDLFVVQAIRGCDVYRRAFYGLYQTFRLLSDMGKLPNGIYSIDEDFFGYYLAPMFNSVKRMAVNAEHAFSVFFGAEPYENAAYLFDLNEQRKELVAEYFAKIANSVSSGNQPFADAGIYISDAPGGITGLIAQKIMGFTGKPVLVLREENGVYKGSGRSPEWYPFYTRCSSKFYIAGHEGAFGAGFTDKRELKAFAAYLSNDVAAVMAQLGEEFFRHAGEYYDFVISADGSEDIDIDILAFREFLADMHRFHPFGKGFEKPKLRLKLNPCDEQTWSVMGSVKQHLKIVMEHGFTVLCWNQAQYVKLEGHTEPVYIDGYLDMSEYNGSHSINFIGTVAVEGNGDTYE